MRGGRPQPRHRAARRAARQPPQPRGPGVATVPRTRLLALDLDGTILSPQLELDPRDAAAVARAQEAGMAVIACTGRPFPGALPWVQRLQLPHPFVCYQGAQVRTPGGQTLLDHGIEHELAMEVIRLCRGRDLHVQGYRDDRLLVERDRPEAREYAGHAQMPINLVADLDAALGPTTPKLVIVAGRTAVEALLPELRERWRGRLNAATSMPTYLELTSQRADKRAALEFLAGRLGIERAATAAAGDGRNDATMLEWAGRAFAVEGAPEEVVRAARGRVIPAPGGAGIEALIGELLS